MEKLVAILQLGIQYELREDSILPKVPGVDTELWKILLWENTSYGCVSLSKYTFDISIMLPIVRAIDLTPRLVGSAVFAGLDDKVFAPFIDKLKKYIADNLKDADCDVIRVLNTIARTIDHMLDLVANIDIIKPSIKSAKLI